MSESTSIVKMLEDFISVSSGYIWYVVPFILMGTGIYFFYLLKGVQFRYFGTA